MSQLVVVFDSDEARLVKAIDKIIQKETALRTGMKSTEEQGKKTGKALEGAGASGEKSFGASAIANLSSYAAGMLTIGTAVSAVNKLLGDMQQIAREAGAEVMSAASGLGPLAQLSGGKPGAFRGMTAEARKTFAEGGAASLKEAGDLQGALEQAGFAGDREFVSALRSAEVIENAPEAVTAAQRLQAAMGADETGGLREMFSKAFAASAPSSGRADTLMAAAEQPGLMARELGFSDEELLAAMGTIAVQTSAGEASTRLRSLYEGFSEAGYIGKGMSQEEILRDIQSQGLDYNELKEVLGGRKEAVSAYLGLTSAEQWKTYQDTLSATERANTEDRAAKAIAEAQEDPTVAVAMKARQAENQRKLREEDIGLMNKMADAALDSEKSEIYDRYGTGLAGKAMAAAAGGFDATTRFFVGDEEQLKDRLYGTGLGSEMTNKDLQAGYQQQYEVIKAQQKAAEEMRAAARELKEANRSPTGANAAREHQAAMATQ